MKDTFFSKAYKEQLDVSFVRCKNLEKTKFNLLYNFVFYFNCDNSKIRFDYYLESQLKNLEKAFHELGKTFIVVNSQNISDKELELLQYYFPSFEITDSCSVTFLSTISVSSKTYS